MGYIIRNGVVVGREPDTAAPPGYSDTYSTRSGGVTQRNTGAAARPEYRTPYTPPPAPPPGPTLQQTLSNQGTLPPVQNQPPAPPNGGSLAISGSTVPSAFGEGSTIGQGYGGREMSTGGSAEATQANAFRTGGGQQLAQQYSTQAKSTNWADEQYDTYGPSGPQSQQLSNTFGNNIYARGAQEQINKDWGQANQSYMAARPWWQQGIYGGGTRQLYGDLMAERNGNSPYTWLLSNFSPQATMASTAPGAMQVFNTGYRGTGQIYGNDLTRGFGDYFNENFGQNMNWAGMQQQWNQFMGSMPTDGGNVSSPQGIANQLSMTLAQRQMMNNVLGEAAKTDPRVKQYLDMYNAQSAQGEASARASLQQSVTPQKKKGGILGAVTGFMKNIGGTIESLVTNPHFGSMTQMIDAATKMPTFKSWNEPANIGDFVAMGPMTHAVEKAGGEGGLATPRMIGTMFGAAAAAPAIAGLAAQAGAGAAAPAIGAGATGAAQGALSSAIGGGDIGKGMLVGGLGGALGGGTGAISQALTQAGVNPQVAAMLAKGLTGAGSAALKGGDPLMGGLMGAGGVGLNQLIGAMQNGNLDQLWGLNNLQGAPGGGQMFEDYGMDFTGGGSGDEFGNVDLGFGQSGLEGGFDTSFEMPATFDAMNMGGGGMDEYGNMEGYDNPGAMDTSQAPDAGFNLQSGMPELGTGGGGGGFDLNSLLKLAPSLISILGGGGGSTSGGSATGTRLPTGGQSSTTGQQTGGNQGSLFGLISSIQGYNSADRASEYMKQQMGQAVDPAAHLRKPAGDWLSTLMNDPMNNPWVKGMHEHELNRLTAKDSQSGALFNDADRSNQLIGILADKFPAMAGVGMTTSGASTSPADYGNVQANMMKSYWPLEMAKANAIGGGLSQVGGATQSISEILNLMKQLGGGQA